MPCFGSSAKEHAGKSCKGQIVPDLLARLSSAQPNQAPKTRKTAWASNSASWTPWDKQIVVITHQLYSTACAKARQLRSPALLQEHHHQPASQDYLRQAAASSKPLQLSPSARVPAAGLNPHLGGPLCWGLASKSLLQLPQGSQGHLPASTTQKFKHLARLPHLWAHTPASRPPHRPALGGTSINNDRIQLSGRNAWNFLPAWSAWFSLPNPSWGLLKRNRKLSVPA